MFFKYILPIYILIMSLISIVVCIYDKKISKKKIYQKSLIEVMQGKTSPQQEEAIQFAWDAFEKSQGEYKLLLLQDDGTREFQQILQNKEEEITTLKKVLKENLLGQF